MGKLAIVLLTCLSLTGCYSPFLNKSRLIVLKPEGELNVEDLMSGKIGDFKGIAFIATFPADKCGSLTFKDDNLSMSIWEPEDKK